MRSDIEKLFGFKLGQRVRCRVIKSHPEPDMRHDGFEGEILSFVVPLSGEPFVVVAKGKKETGARTSHHFAPSDLEAA